MSKINDGGPAFPQDVVNPEAGHFEGRYEIVRQVPGMSLRDWFAGQALIAIMDRAEYRKKQLQLEIEELAECDANEAYMLADAMLKARNA